MENLEKFYLNIIESVKLLSLPFEKQKAYFESFVDAPFEVLDTFDNAMLQLPKLIENGRFSNEQIAALLRLQNMIDFTARNPELENLHEEQFATRIEWNNIREQASSVLKIIEKPQENLGK